MLPPTIANLRDLAEYASIDEAWHGAAGRDWARAIKPTLNVDTKTLELATE
jgi:hypothetical protein